LGDLGMYRLKDLGRPEQIFQVRHPRLRDDFPPLRSLDVTPNNLPVHLTSFVGREAELADLLHLARANRLLTLTGSGGVGKTRLAARVAAELAAGHRDGAWWVELAPLADPDLVTETVLNVLGVGDAAGTSALQRLVVHLAGRDLLLVLDNCEHLVEACAALVDPLLRRRTRTPLLRLGKSHPDRTGGRPVGRTRGQQRGDRPGPVHQPEHRQGPPVARLRQGRPGQPAPNSRPRSPAASGRPIRRRSLVSCRFQPALNQEVLCVPMFLVARANAPVSSPPPWPPSPGP
jgi:hypothetical protein